MINVIKDGVKLDLEKLYDDKTNRYILNFDGLYIECNFESYKLSCGNKCFLILGEFCNVDIGSECLMTCKKNNIIKCKDKSNIVCGQACVITSGDDCLIIYDNNCSVTCGYNCIIIRKDTRELIKPKRGQTIKICENSGYIIEETTTVKINNKYMTLSAEEVKNLRNQLCCDCQEEKKSDNT